MTLDLHWDKTLIHMWQSFSFSTTMSDSVPKEVASSQHDSEQGATKKASSVLSVDSSAESLSVGVLIAQESENEIRYRTCSWQKVCIVI